jgi:hypothetical protein
MQSCTSEVTAPRRTISVETHVHQHLRRARIAGICKSCGCTIEVGTTYMHTAVETIGTPGRFRTCLTCCENWNS